MEEKVFRLAAVAAELKQHFVEARLHTDGGPRKDENRRRQREMTNSVANPYYVIVDPNAPTDFHRQLAGATTESGFLEYLRGK